LSSRSLAGTRRGTDPGGTRPVAQTGIASVKASAKRSFLLAAGGAYIKLDGTNIEIGAPGAVQFKGGGKSLSDPRGGGDSAGLGSAKAGPCNFGLQETAENGDAVVPLNA
jgi:type VI secretion system secreted protein VgrG